MNLYVVVFLACLNGYFIDGDARVDTAFFTDVKQAIEFKMAKESMIAAGVYPKNFKPRIFKIVMQKKMCFNPKEPSEQIACYGDEIFKIFEINAIPLKPVKPAIEYEITESTVVIKGKKK